MFIKPKEVEVRALREPSASNVQWCSAEDAHYFGVYEGEPGAFEWVADFNNQLDAVRYATERALRFGAVCFNRIGEL